MYGESISRIIKKHKKHNQKKTKNQSKFITTREPVILGEKSGDFKNLFDDHAMKIRLPVKLTVL